MVRRSPIVAALAAALATLLSLGLLTTGTPARAEDPNPHAQPDPPRQNTLTFPMHLDDRGRYVTEAQKRLEWLGYPISWHEALKGTFGRTTERAVRRVQDKFFLPETGKVNEATWRMIRRTSGTVGELPAACRISGKVLCIDKTAKLLRYVRNGEVVQTLDVRFGVPGLETPVGTFRVWFRWRDATSGINGPGQPRAPMPYALFFAGDIAVHYSPTFAAYGYYPGGGSHGCVNVADLAGMRWLFDQIPVGTRVHVYRS